MARLHHLKLHFVGDIRVSLILHRSLEKRRLDIDGNKFGLISLSPLPVQRATHMSHLPIASTDGQQFSARWAERADVGRQSISPMS
jgi:hypothetical protein